MIDLGASAKLFRNTKVKIGYYNAPITDLNGFKYEQKTCELCKTEQNVFTINPNLNPSPEWICIQCLNSIKIESPHCTEFGYVDINLPEFLKEEDAKSHVKEEAYWEMMRTPRYLALQSENWLCHCDDFMDFIGTWEAPDFTKNSKDGNGKNLFISMTDESSQHLWDDFELMESEGKHTWQDCLYYAFKCRKCETMRGHWEM